MPLLILSTAVLMINYNAKQNVGYQNTWIAFQVIIVSVFKYISTEKNLSSNEMCVNAGKGALLDA